MIILLSYIPRVIFSLLTRFFFLCQKKIREKRKSIYIYIFGIAKAWKLLHILEVCILALFVDKLLNFLITPRPVL